MLEELTWAFLSLAVAQPHTGAAAVFVDELDAGRQELLQAQRQ
jgi:hypothetical protein